MAWLRLGLEMGAAGEGLTSSSRLVLPGEQPSLSGAR